MSKKPNTPATNQPVSCDVCLKEIPPSAAKNEEAAGYFMHFCGLECYDVWKKQEVNDTNIANDGKVK